MERVELYPSFQKKSYTNAFAIFAWLFVIGSFVGLIYALYTGFNAAFLGGDWIYVLYLIFGIMQLKITDYMKRQLRSYIVMDEDEIRYKLPNEKTAESLVISEIRGINVGTMEIEITTDKEKRTMALNNLDYQRVRKVKEMFEELKLRVEGMNAGE